LIATTRKMIRSAVSALLLAVIASSTSQAQDARVQVLNPPGSTYTTAAGINNKGITVGAFELPGQTLEAFAYNPATNKYKAIKYPGAVYTIGLGVNDANTVVGTFAMEDGQNHGFFLMNGKTFTQYDVDGSSGTVVQGINLAGDFAGTVGSNGDYQGFVSIGGTVTTFAVNGRPTDAYAINASNDVVGFFVNTQLTGTHGFVRDGAGNTTQIDYPDSLSTACTGINDAGVITGVYTDKAVVDHAFVLVNGKYRTLGDAYAAGINNRGAIVGSFVSKNNGRTFGFLSPPRH
jgi:hypothetical protein